MFLWYYQFYAYLYGYTKFFTQLIQKPHRKYIKVSIPLLYLFTNYILNLNGNNKASCEAGYLHQSCVIFDCEKLNHSFNYLVKCIK